MKIVMKRLVLSVSLAMAGGGVASAADLGGEYAAVPLCAAGANSSLLDTASDAELTRDVVRLMDEAVAVSNSPTWINSARPAYVWANETKVACGKAYGYLQYSVRDEDMLSKCGCFHDRMVSFMH